MRIVSLHRYPVKGLSPERIGRAVLEAGGYFPGDRLFAIENGPSGFDPGAPVHQPKIKYLMLMRNEGLARLATRYDDASGALHIANDGEEVVVDLKTDDGRAALSAFFERFMPDELRGRPELLTAPPGYRFSDSRSGYVSLINKASVADLEDRIGAPVDPLRFRGNILVEGIDPWQELDWVGRVIEAPSGLRLRGIKRIERCAATNVDPQTGIRDLQIPRALMSHYGHVDCGLYCEIVEGGALAEGERLSLAENREPARETAIP